MTDYQQWRSRLTLEQIFAENESIAYPTFFSDGVVYLTRLADENNRSALVHRRFADPECQQVLTPAPFNLRTRICEYGGKPFWLIGTRLIFCHDDDQCLYHCDLADSNSLPQLLSGDPSSPGLYRHADVVTLDDDHCLAVVEAYEGENAHPIAYLGLISANAERTVPVRLPPRADFFSNLVVDRQRQRVAWVQWNHPNMPWDETELWIAEYHQQGGEFELRSPRRITLDKGASVCQLCFASGQLFFVADFPEKASTDAANFWNIYRLDLAGEGHDIVAVSEDLREYGYPHWQFGDHRLVASRDRALVAIGTSGEGDTLSVFDAKTWSKREVRNDAVYFQHLSVGQDDRILMIAHYRDRAPAILELDSDSGRLQVRYQLRSQVARSDISPATHLSYPTTQGEQAFAYYYRPTNSNYSRPTSPPPLLVMVHGGPTARAYPYFDLQKQFWTQNGFAVVDVNHRGSNGYGRNYRDRLYGGWGILDAEDVRACIESLIASGEAAANQVMIRGKSAGGYAVLRALTEFPSLFVAGACYYGIGNLVTLAETTHKFEAKYTDRLIGEPFDGTRAQRVESAYFQRSPIKKVADIQAAMIVFQGGQDNVVPPAVAHEMVATLKKQNLRYKYVEYASEGHGFRDPASNIDAWQQELDFYRNVMSDHHE